MKRHLWLLAAILAASCAPATQDAGPRLIALEGGSCPRTLIGVRYRVEAILGPDYTICALHPLEPGLPRAELRVGGIWAFQGETPFAGFTPTVAGPIAWFAAPSREPGIPGELSAFIPTQLGRPEFAELIVYLPLRQSRDAVRDQLLRAIVEASMRPNNSSKPTPLRGAA